VVPLESLYNITNINDITSGSKRPLESSLSEPNMESKQVRGRELSSREDDFSSSDTDGEGEYSGGLSSPSEAEEEDQPPLGTMK
jgi:hypothetical protein